MNASEIWLKHFIGFLKSVTPKSSGVLEALDLRPFWGHDRPNRGGRFLAWLYTTGGLACLIWAVVVWFYIVALIFSAGHDIQVSEIVRFQVAASIGGLVIFVFNWMGISAHLTYTCHDFLNER